MIRKINKFEKILFVSLIIFSFAFCFSAKAAVLGETKNFSIDPSYDISGRKETSATLQKVSNKLYFYTEDAFWDKLSQEDKNKMNSDFNNLADEFESKIYPTLTSTFGFEWKPGIDNDERITILFHRMKQNRAGYFNSGNEYSKILVPASNEREMIYLNADYISNSLIKSFLSHEFVHLINFNQKEKIQGIEEDIWLNEARAEYAPTLCGYDSQYQGSNLQKRVQEFLNNPSDSITDWQGGVADYGALNIFTQYLVDNYGVKILTDSLQSSKKGIDSVNYALNKNGYQEDFSQVFTNWTIAVLINNCSLGEKYCYKNLNLKNLKLVPVSNFLPFDAQSTLSVNYITKVWSGNWHKVFGGGGTLIFEFGGGIGGQFKVPYVVCENSTNCSVNFLTLNQNREGKIILEDFNTKYTFLIVIPSAQNLTSSFNGSFPTFSFSWKVTMEAKNPDETAIIIINQLLAQIESLKAEIAKLQAARLANNTESCQKLNNNLYFGLSNNQEVSCLQGFLKNQGSEIYPEALITGNFLSLTKSAVIRFQEKYAQEILNPLGLSKGTGYVGAMTRTKINQLLSY